jgi:hypothetical protein
MAFNLPIKKYQLAPLNIVDGDISIISPGKLGPVSTATFLGRITAGTGNVEVLTAAQATSLLNVFTDTLKGLVPLSGGGTTTFLRADGTWAVPGGGGTVTSVTDDGNTVVVVDNTNPATPVVTFAGVKVDNTTITGVGTVASPLKVIGGSLDFALTVRASTTAALAGSPTYNNGTAGVGATLTRTGNGALPAQDGVTLIVNDRLLVQNQADQTQNGVYVVTQVGANGGGGSPYILTRTTDSDQSSELDDQVVIPSEGTLSGKIYSQQTASPVIGTNNIVYTLTNGVYVTQQITLVDGYFKTTC